MVKGADKVILPNHNQRIVEHKYSAIGRYFLEAHGNNNLLSKFVYFG